MNGHERLQYNIQFTPSILSSIPDIIFPVCWTDLSGTINDPLAQEFKKSVYGALAWKGYLQYGGMALAIALGATVFTYAIYLFTTPEKSRYVSIKGRNQVTSISPSSEEIEAEEHKILNDAGKDK